MRRAGRTLPAYREVFFTDAREAILKRLASKEATLASRLEEVLRKEPSVARVNRIAARPSSARLALLRLGSKLRALHPRKQRRAPGHTTPDPRTRGCGERRRAPVLYKLEADERVSTRSRPPTTTRGVSTAHDEEFFVGQGARTHRTCSPSAHQMSISAPRADPRK